MSSVRLTARLAWSSACDPSIDAIPRVKALALREGFRFKPVDVDRESKVANAYDIKLVPTVVFEIARGDFNVELLRFSGLRSQREMKPLFERARRKAELLVAKKTAGKR
jgi:thioredoxin-like negative regulator of GroEL